MSGSKDINIKLKIWRQKGPSDKGGMASYDVPGVSTDSSFLEMLDLVNERLMEKGEEPIAIDHDCREGICGACSLVINGVPHGPRSATTTTLRMWRPGSSPALGISRCCTARR